MKIIDFEKKGNVVRFYLGNNDCEDYHGDDWNDSPYDCNAGKVYEEYIVGYRDIVFPFGYTVLEPCNDYETNCSWCKDDMKSCKVPCIVANNPEDDWYADRFGKMCADAKAVKFYFGDMMEASDELTVFTRDLRL